MTARDLYVSLLWCQYFRYCMVGYHSYVVIALLHHLANGSMEIADKIVNAFLTQVSG